MIYEQNFNPEISLLKRMVDERRKYACAGDEYSSSHILILILDFAQRQSLKQDFSVDLVHR